MLCWTLVVKVYAMSDSCSQRTLVDDFILRQLSLTDTRLSAITIKTINEEETMSTRVANNLVISCKAEFGRNYLVVETKLPRTYSQSNIPICAEPVPTQMLQTIESSVARKGTIMSRW